MIDIFGLRGLTLNVKRRRQETALSQDPVTAPPPPAPTGVRLRQSPENPTNAGYDSSSQINWLCRCFDPYRLKTTKTLPSLVQNSPFLGLAEFRSGCRLLLHHSPCSPTISEL